MYNLAMARLPGDDPDEDDYNVALTEAEMRSIYHTKAEERETETDYNEAPKEVDMNGPLEERKE